MRIGRQCTPIALDSRRIRAAAPAHVHAHDDVYDRPLDAVVSRRRRSGTPRGVLAEHGLTNRLARRIIRTLTHFFNCVRESLSPEKIACWSPSEGALRPHAEMSAPGITITSSLVGGGTPPGRICNSPKPTWLDLRPRSPPFSGRTIDVSWAGQTACRRRLDGDRDCRSGNA